MVAAIARRFAATLQEAGAALPDDWEPLEPPPAILDSCQTAIRLGVIEPDALEDYYGRAMPAELLHQLCGDAPPTPLLWRPLELERLPILRGALTGAFQALAAAGLDPATCLGARSPEALLRGRPTLAHLYAGALFGSGFPMIGATPNHGRAIAAWAEAHGLDPDGATDLWLSGNVLHERFHGQRRALLRRPDSWMVQECASIHLGWTARPGHVLPEAHGAAVPAGAPYLMVALALARHIGAGALWRVGLLGEPLARHTTRRVEAALTVAEWQSLRAQRRPQFAPDGHRPVAWIKLLDAARGPAPLDALLDAVAARDDLLEPGGPVTEGPELLAEAARLDWADLPWYRAPVSEADRALIEPAVRGLFLVHRLAPTFLTLPDPLPGDQLMLDPRACLLQAARRPHGVYNEPARWLFPPPLSRRVSERGAERVVVTGATRGRLMEVVRRLDELAMGEGALPREVEVAAG